ncbi:MAG: hypothetical protein AAF693_13105 [Bacteroidota bacterium]
MSEKIEKLKLKLSEKLDEAKGKVDYVRETINSSKEKLRKSFNGHESSSDELGDSTNEKLGKVRKKIKKYRANLEQTLKEYEEQQTVELAEQRAKYSEKYARACIQMVLKSVDRAEKAVAESIVAAEVVEELRD